jgi:hypothetical protein
MTPTERKLAELEAEVARLKSAQPTPIDRAAEGAWRDKMREIEDRRALRDATSFYSRDQLAAMSAVDAQAIVHDQRNAPRGPSGVIPSTARATAIRPTGGSGFQHLTPLRNGLGQGK